MTSDQSSSNVDAESNIRNENHQNNNNDDNPPQVTDEIHSSMSPPSALPSHPARMMTNNNSLEEKIKEFAKLLSTKVSLNTGKSTPTASKPAVVAAAEAATTITLELNQRGAAAQAMLAMYDEKILNEEKAAAILIIPALDIKSSNNNSESQHSRGAAPAEGKASTPPPPSAVPLPGIGETRASVGLLNNNTSNMTSIVRPNMAASVLTAATNTAAAVEQKAAQNVSKQTSWTKTTLPQASHAVATNAAEFFSNLIDSRLRSWTLLLLRHSLSTGEHESRSRLLRMLSASIKVIHSETRFKTLQLPPSAAGQPKEADVILPLLFEVVLKLTVQDKIETVTLRAPGTISAHVADPQEGKLFSTVVVNLDTGLMLNSMVDQARILVFKAVATATKTPLPPIQSPGAAGGSSNSSATPEAPTDSSCDPTDPASAPPNLAGFRSSLNLSQPPPSSSPDQANSESPALQKARHSALRLTSILYGKGDSSSASGGGGAQSALGMRRIRSVKWDTPATLPKLGLTPGALAPSPKKARMAQSMAQNVCKLKSFKSFGRPHGGDFGSGPRNATFAAFGGSEGGARLSVWGRDGRLAQHPVPLQAGGGVQSDHMGLTGVADKNATFDLSRLMQNRRASATGGAGAPAALPRTTTGLEKWLVHESTGRR